LYFRVLAGPSIRTENGMKRFLAGAVIVVASVIGPSASAAAAHAGPVASAATPIAVPVVVPVAAFPVASAATADAPTYPPQFSVFIYLSVTIVAPGVFIQITFSFCWIGETVTFTLGPSSASATCGGTGGGNARGIMAPSAGGTATVSLPAPDEPGTYPVQGKAETSGAAASAPLTVTDPLLSDAVANLTSSGPADSRTVWIGGSALLAGVGLAGVAAYRRRPASA
jgi:hypothetical protein